MTSAKSDDRLPTPSRDQRSATEYRLSISSNPGSRRSSLGTTNNNESIEGEKVIETYLLPQIQELADAVITLDSNCTQMNFIHESLIDLNESLGSLLYGLMCNSWCVDFPNMPHGTASELKRAQELVALETTKQQLLRQLAAPSPKPPPVPEDTRENRAGQHEQRIPGMRTYQKKVAQARGFRGLGRPPPPPVPQELASPSVNELNDDDNTDASFVSNPAISAPLAKQLRRKSILHTMRNSAANSVDLLGPGRRRSLAVSATRIVNPNQNVPNLGVSGRNTSQNRKVPGTRQLGSLRNRPPFR
ncbi:LAMI_0H04962g1_1 [Lachancea mirantina]|uniref:DASH complex subunit DAM1 n=1 Tax=Lachancea mirantina TaxID=1230905 RepID=A0A1G4KER0_9SACH|nr:LAMI_0H04962g1_1 [Lachancea mirantina]